MSKLKFENKTADVLIKCIRALGHRGVIEACISELQGQDFGRPNLTEKEIQEELQEWIEGFKKTGNKNFKTKRMINAQIEASKLFDQDDQENNHKQSSHSFELETMKAFSKCFHKINVPDSITASFFELWRNVAKFDDAQSEEKIRGYLNEWMKGYKKTGNINYQIKALFVKK